MIVRRTCVALTVCAAFSGLLFAQSAAPPAGGAPPQVRLIIPGDPLIGQPSITVDNAWYSEPLPRRDIFQMIPIVVPPASQWIERERALFSSALHGTKFDVVIAPAQVQGYGFDRATRSLMTAMLAERIGSIAPNPYIVQRALGEGRRRIEDSEIITIAEDIGATRVIVPIAGHDGAHRLLLTIKLFEREKGGTKWNTVKSKSWSDRSFTDERPPALVFNDLIAEVLAYSDLTAIPRPASQQGAKALLSVLPKSPRDAMRAADSDPMQRAMILQLFGTLSTRVPARYRERLFEESLVALEDVADRSPATESTKGLLRARAFYYLNSRPAALALLQDVKSPEARAFGEFVNGNLKEMEQAVDKTTNALWRLMLEFDLQEMRLRYLVPAAINKSAFIEKTTEQNPAWKQLFKRRIDEKDFSQLEDNVTLKRVMDLEFPIKDFDTESMVRGAMALGKPVDTNEIGSKVFEHINRVRTNEGLIVACAKSTARCAAADYLDLLEATAIANADRALWRLYEFQGLPDVATALANRLAGTLSGQPDYVLALGNMQLKRMEKNPSGPNMADIDAITRTAAEAAYFEHGQSQVSSDALILMGIPSPGSMPYLAAYAFEFPPRPYWYPTGEADARARTQLEYTPFNVNLADGLLASNDAAQTAAIRESLQNRFHGNPDRERVLLAGQSKGDEGSIDSLQAAIAARPDIWDNYPKLIAAQIMERGDYVAAAKVADSFPGFKDPKKYNAIALSNYAVDPASWFYWRGHIEESRRFFKIAADTQTGSQASLIGAQRLLVLDGKYEQAAEYALQRAQRYNDRFGYRDYLSWLFVIGHNKEAWAAFDQLHSAFDSREVWLAADIGQYRAARDWPALSKWLLTEPMKSSASKSEKFALSDAVRLNAIDRQPSSDLPDVLEAIEGRPTGQVENGQAIRLPTPDGPPGAMYMVQRSLFRSNEREPLKDNMTVRAHQYLFAKAYVPLRAGRFDEAVTRFDEMAAFYPIEGTFLYENGTYALPYFAWASAKSGDKLGLESFLKQLPKERRNFDYHLAMAYFSGLRGDAASATASLRTAFNYRPNADERPITSEWQWAEACDWLFSATGDSRYRDMALSWARSHQRIQPYYAWAYAMEAKLATKETDRRRALGFALYLDPLSDSIAKISPAKKDAARNWFAANNPFKVARTKDGDGKRAAAVDRSVAVLQ